MLVYCNYLSLEGKNAYEDVFSAIAGWIKKKTGERVRVTNLKGANSFEVNGMWVATEKADLTEPYLYSVIIKHPDNEVKGRQWVLEIGIESNSKYTNVSCVLKTDEISSLVTDQVDATRPLLIKYIIDNSQLVKNAPGLRVKLLDATTDTYRALQYEIDRPDRSYPLVLVSPKRNGEYLVDVNRLQDQLVGLAQVIEVSVDVDTYEMEESLGRRYSAWDGAVNIIYSPFKGGKVHNKLLRSDIIEDIGNRQIDRLRYILAIITHNTNIPNLRRQIRPEGVKAKFLKEKYIGQVVNASKVDDKYKKDIEDLLEMAAAQEEQFKQNLERVELDKLYVEEARDRLEEKLASANWKIEGLQYQLSSASDLDKSYDRKEFFDFCCRSDEPNLEEALYLVKDNFSDLCVVLDGAIESARNASSFKKGRRFLYMINRLINEYLPQYLEGGDNQARNVFTRNEYSATESETVTSSPKLRSYREFVYKGDEVQMFQHLRVGVADNIEHTIRVHFFVDKEEKKVVIGYCGEHLPVASH